MQSFQLLKVHLSVTSCRNAYLLTLVVIVQSNKNWLPCTFFHFIYLSSSPNKAVNCLNRQIAHVSVCPECYTQSNSEVFDFPRIIQAYTYLIMQCCCVRLSYNSTSVSLGLLKVWYPPLGKVRPRWASEFFVTCCLRFNTLIFASSISLSILFRDL